MTHLHRRTFIYEAHDFFIERTGATEQIGLVFVEHFACDVRSIGDVMRMFTREQVILHMYHGVSI